MIATCGNADRRPLQCWKSCHGFMRKLPMHEHATALASPCDI